MVFGWFGWKWLDAVVRDVGGEGKIGVEIR
jgi:hypothetical protein